MRSAASDPSSLLGRFPAFEDAFPGLSYAPRLPGHLVAEVREVVAQARRFNDEVARPLGVALDRRTQEDPGYMPSELVEEANRRGFYTQWVPRMFGGKGQCLPSMSAFVEEVASACLGIANVIGVHYLGVAGLIAAANPGLANRVLREVARGERTHRPCLVALAVTEPSAGTDVEEVELLARGRVTCRAERVTGGYRVTGTKVFISMGHLSTWVVLYAYADTKRPAESTLGLVVKAGTPGFTLGRHEDKMGQRVCPASVLEFDDCFVPDDQVLFDAREVGRRVGRSPREVGERYLDNVLGSTRAGVGAFGTGAARGALEAALAFARDTHVDGEPLIGREWVQSLVAEMYKNVALGRLAYQEANSASGLRGLYRVLQSPAVFHALRLLPQAWFDSVLPRLIGRPQTATVMAKLLYGGGDPADQRSCSGWGSLAKVTGTDMGVKNAQLALELMGQAGLRQDRGVEKILRDAKLLQIYEGTNQLNRLNLYKCLLASEAPGSSPFAEPPPNGGGDEMC